MLRMLSKRLPRFVAVAIALVAFTWSYHHGAVIGYLRNQASSLERFTLVLFLVVPDCRHGASTPGQSAHFVARASSNTSQERPGLL